MYTCIYQISLNSYRKWQNDHQLKYQNDLAESLSMLFKAVLVSHTCSIEDTHLSLNIQTHLDL